MRIRPIFALAFGPETIGRMRLSIVIRQIQMLALTIWPNHSSAQRHDATRDTSGSFIKPSGKCHDRVRLAIWHEIGLLHPD